MVTCGKHGSNLFDAYDCDNVANLRDALLVAGKHVGKTYMIGTLANHRDAADGVLFKSGVDTLIQG